MPVTKSAAKAARQNLRHLRRNLIIKRRMKSEIRALIAAIAAGEKQSLPEKLQSAHSTIDKAAQHNLIHKNKAARQKSRLAKMTAAKPAKASATPAKKPASKAPRRVEGPAPKTDSK